MDVVPKLSISVRKRVLVDLKVFIYRVYEHKANIFF